MSEYEQELVKEIKAEAGHFPLTLENSIRIKALCEALLNPKVENSDESISSQCNSLGDLSELR